MILKGQESRSPRFSVVGARSVCYMPLDIIFSLSHEVVNLFAGRFFSPVPAVFPVEIN